MSLLIETLKNLNETEFNAIYDDAMKTRNEARDAFYAARSEGAEEIDFLELVMRKACDEFSVVYNVYFGGKHPGDGVDPMSEF